MLVENAPPTKCYCPVRDTMLVENATPLSRRDTMLVENATPTKCYCPVRDKMLCGRTPVSLSRPYGTMLLSRGMFSTNIMSLTGHHKESLCTFSTNILSLTGQWDSTGFAFLPTSCPYGTETRRTINTTLRRSRQGSIATRNAPTYLDSCPLFPDPYPLAPIP